MRASVASISKKLITTFFAATLALGLVSTAAFAVEDGGAEAPQSAESAGADSQDIPQAEAWGYENQAASEEFQDGSVGREPAPADGEATPEDNVMTGDGSNLAIPAATERINQDMTLQTRTVAQAEATRSFFLAETLENTRTIPMVSANLPLDTGSDVVDAEGEGSSPEDEGDAEGDDPDSEGDSSNGVVSTEASDSERSGEISPESTVVGSFTYLGMTFAIEAGGESVALVAVDYAKLPDEYMEKQVMVVPDAVTPDGIDYYSVTRIADNAFASLTKENADPDYVGCVSLFTDEELLAKVGIDASEAEAFLNPESDMIDLDGDGEMDTVANPLKDCTGILAMSIPASVSSIEDKAFSGFDTLQYLVVAEDNPTYASYDGALYGADLTNLRLIPEGRVGSVRVAPSATTIDPEAFSHCPSVDTVVADPGSEIDRLISVGDKEITGIPKTIPLPSSFVEINSSGEAEMSSSKWTRLSVLSQLLGTEHTSDLSLTVSAFESRATNGVTFNYDNFFKLFPNGSVFSVTYGNGTGNGLYITDPKWEPMARFYGPMLSSLGTTLVFTSSKSYSPGDKTLTSDKNAYWDYFCEIYTKQEARLQGFSSNFTFHLGNQKPFYQFKDKCTSDKWSTRPIYMGMPSDKIINYSPEPLYQLGLPSIITFEGPESYSDSNGSWKYNYAAFRHRIKDGGYGLSTESTSGCTSHGNLRMEIYTGTKDGFYSDEQVFVVGSPSSITKVTNSSSYSNELQISGTALMLEPLGSSFATSWYPKNSNYIADTSINPDSKTAKPAIRIRETSDIDRNPIAVPNSSTQTFFGWNTKYSAKTTESTGWYAKGGHLTTDDGTVISSRSQESQVLNLYAIYGTKTGYSITLDKIATSAVSGTGSVYYWSDMGYTKTSAASDCVTILSGEKLVDTVPTRSGYKFKGYYSATSGGTQYVDANGNLTTNGYNHVPTGAETWYAQWETENYTVSFNANGGTGSMSPLSKQVNVSYNLPANAFTREGYTFSGWATSSSGSVAFANQASVSNASSSLNVSAGGSVTLYAVWSKKTVYTITLNSNGGPSSNITRYYWTDVGFTSNSSGTPAKVTTVPVPTTRAGYSFGGYYTSRNSTTLEASGTQCVNASGTILATSSTSTTWYAKWNASTRHAITLDKHSGTGGTSTVYYWTGLGYTKSNAYGSSAVTSGNKLVDSLPTRAGYEFQGYYSGTATTTGIVGTHGSGTQYVDKEGNLTSSAPASYGATATWHARWAALTKYTVTLDRNGSTSTPSSICYWTGIGFTSSSSSDTAITSITKPVKTGYTFEGYYSAETNDNGSGTCYIDKDGKITASSSTGGTWYAKWTRLTDHKVTLSSVKSGASPATQYVYYWPEQGYVKTQGATSVVAKGSSIVTVPTLTGYDFAGYYDTSATTGGTQTIDGSGNLKVDKSSMALSGAKTWYGRWTAHTYTVTFNGNGENSSVSPASKSAEYDEDVTLPTPSRTGYTFSKWTTEKNGTGDSYTTSAKNLSATQGASVPLYAQWTANRYAISFNANGGDSEMEGRTRTATYDAKPAAVPVEHTNREGYDFAGWWTADDDDATQYFDSLGEPLRAWKIADDATLVARWTVGSCHPVYLSDPDMDTKAGPLYYWPGHGYVASDGSEDTFDPGDKVITPPTDATGHCRFDGYFESADEDAKMMIAADGTLTEDAPALTASAGWVAKWTQVSSEVLFDANYGEWDPQMKVRGTASVDPVLYGQSFAGSLDAALEGGFKAPVRRGHAFMGYWTLPNNGEVALGDEPQGDAWITVDEDGALVLSDKAWDVYPDSMGGSITLYAAWGVEEIDVSLKVHEGVDDDTEQVEVAGEDAVPASITWRFGEDAPSLPSPYGGAFSRNGYAFKGWCYGYGSSKVRLSDKEGEPYPATWDALWDTDVRSIEIRPDWEANRYTLEFALDLPATEGLDVPDAPAPITVSYDGRLSLPRPEFGAYVLEWTVAGEPFESAHMTSGRFTPQGDVASQTEAPIVVHASWSAPEGERRFTLFTGHPGTGEVLNAEELPFAYGTPVSLADLSPNPGIIEGYTFEGWARAESADAARAMIEGRDVTGDIWTSFSGLQTQDLYFVAKWRAAAFKVSFATSPSKEGSLDYFDVVNDALVDKAIEGDDAPQTWSAVYAKVHPGASRNEIAHAASLVYDVELGAFTLPDVQRTGYDFLGWEAVDEESAELLDGGTTIDPRKQAADIGLRDVAYRPTFAPADYTVHLKGNGVAADEEPIKVNYEESFEMPYPRTLATGSVFRCWADVSKLYSVSTDKVFLRGASVPIAPSTASDGKHVFGLAELAPEGTREITLYAIWEDSYRVQVPLAATLAIDVDSGDVIAGSHTIKPLNEDDTKVYEIESLRYDPAYDDEGRLAFAGAERGEVYLSVYAGLPKGIDERALLDADKVGERGAIAYGEDKTVKPLLIELGTSVNPVRYDKEDLEAVTERGSHGFLPFEVAKDKWLTVRYGLYFPNKENAVDFDLVRGIHDWRLPENDAGGVGGTSAWSNKIANLTYTVSMKTKPTVAE